MAMGYLRRDQGLDETAGSQPIRLFKSIPTYDVRVFDYGPPRVEDKSQLLPDPDSAIGCLKRFGPRPATRMTLVFCDSMLYDGERNIYAGTTAGG